MQDKDITGPETAAANARARKSDAIRVNGMDLGAQDLHRQLSLSAEHISDLELEIEKLRAENSTLQQRCAALADRAAKVEKESKALQGAGQVSPHDLAVLREENQRLTKSNARLEQMLRQLDRERADLLSMAPAGGASNSDRDELWRNQRVAVLVDVQNMYYSAKKIYSSKVSFRRLLPALMRNRKLVRAIAYTVEKEGTDQEKFYEVLRRSGFEIKRRDLIVRSDGSRKGDWDMGIAIDAISLVDKVDVVVLVTGDGDFVALVNMLKGRGVRVEVASFRESTADNLMAATDEHFSIDGRMLVD